MRQHRRKIFALGGVTILVALASTFAFTAGGRAAGAGICADASAPCLVETLAPQSLATGQTGVSLTKFVNPTSATATHTAISLTFSNPVQVGTVQLVVNGSLQTATTCTSTATTVTCPDFGSTVGGSFDKLIVQYSTTTTGALTATGQVMFGESNDNTGGPANDTDTSSDSVAVFDGAGYATACKTSGAAESIAAGDTSLTATLQYVAAATGPSAANGFLPCTPVSAGVIPNSHGVNTEVAVVDFPSIAAPNCPGGQPAGQSFCYAVGTLDFLSGLPKGSNAKNLVLYEALASGGFVFDATKLVVPACSANGLPPSPGAPATSAVNDTCIYARSNLPKGGIELGLHVIASPQDGHYSG
jgi:hypothetical protein